MIEPSGRSRFTIQVKALPVAEVDPEDTLVVSEAAEDLVDHGELATLRAVILGAREDGQEDYRRSS